MTSARPSAERVDELRMYVRGALIGYDRPAIERIMAGLEPFLAALSPSASPALEPCPHCEQVVLVDGEHWVPNGGGWSCARLQEQDR